MTLRRNIRLVAPDRPGFGLSTHDPRRQIMSWPGDVQALASHLKLSKFAVLGVSGGGPHAIACAKGLSQEMMTAVGVVAGAPVWDKGFRSEGLPWYSKLLYLAGNYWPSGTRIISAALVMSSKWLLSTSWAKRKIDKWLEKMSKDAAAKNGRTDNGESSETTPLEAKVASEEDEEQTTEVTRDWLMGQFFEAFAQGTEGFVHETQLITQKNWGFKFEDVEYDTVRMWHGSKDANAPPMTIRDMASRMPHCVLKESDDTHFTIGRLLEEVLEELIPPRKNEEES